MDRDPSPHPSDNSKDFQVESTATLTSLKTIIEEEVNKDGPTKRVTALLIGDQELNCNKAIKDLDMPSPATLSVIFGPWKLEASFSNTRETRWSCDTWAIRVYPGTEEMFEAECKSTRCRNSPHNGEEMKFSKVSAAKTIDANSVVHRLTGYELALQKNPYSAKDLRTLLSRGGNAIVVESTLSSVGGESMKGESLRHVYFVADHIIEMINIEVQSWD